MSDSPKFEYGSIPFGHGNYTVPDPKKPRAGVVLAAPHLSECEPSSLTFSPGYDHRERGLIDGRHDGVPAH